MIRNTCYKAYARHNITPRPPLPTPALPPVTIFSHQDTTRAVVSVMIFKLFPIEDTTFIQVLIHL